MSYSIAQIATIINAETLQPPVEASIEHILFDSRTLIFPESSLFFALGGSRLHGRLFIPELYHKGLRYFVVDDSFTRDQSIQFPGTVFLKVDNVLTAMQQLAAYHRSRFTYPLIGITGSNGKTIVKEWLYQLLNDDFNIVRSPKSYNSQIGVPLSAWLMNENHNLAIFEAGISIPGEMLALQAILRPEIGILTFIGDAHAEGFKDLDEKIREKLLLFSESKVLIYQSDDEHVAGAVRTFIEQNNRGLRSFTWSKKHAANLQVMAIAHKENGSHIECLFKGSAFNFYIPFADDASLHNAISCCCVLLEMGFSPITIQDKMRHLRPVEMRLELKQGINNCSIINDSYSADLDSLSIALDFLLQQQQHEHRTIILSDLLQTGLSSETLYHRISAILQQKQLYRIIGIGPGIGAHAAAFDKLPSAIFFPSTEAFLEQLPSLHFRDETILLKGARIFRFEKISRALELKIHETRLEIDLNALRHNLRTYRKQLRPLVKLMVMVKAFSYGSGSFEVASLLQHAGADYLGVAYADEGVELRKAGIRLPIMVMNTEAAGFESIVKYDLEPELYSFKILKEFGSYLEEQEIIGYKVHIKLDTGMHRLGFEKGDIEQLCLALRTSRRFHIQSVFSHLVGSDDSRHDPFTLQQSRAFEEMATLIEQTLGYDFTRHIGNTAAIHRHPSLQMNMVRLGIGLYGVDSHPDMQGQLKNVTTLKTTISQIRKVKKGESIGYNRMGIVDKDSTIATVRIGYADGYPRVLGNGAGKMLVNGQLAPVIGNICMDMTMLDITGIEASEDDPVVVFGEDLPVSVLAHWAGTIAYEILTNVSQRVKRVYFEE